MLTNPLGYVLESMVLLKDHSFPLIDLKLKHHMAMTLLMQGKAKKEEMNKLVAMSNVTAALWEMGFGKDYPSIHLDGRDALLSVVNRAVTHGSFTPTAAEITSLNMLMELHDAQMEVITVRDIENAVRLVEKKIRSSPDTVKLPVVPDHLR